MTREQKRPLPRFDTLGAKELLELLRHYPPYAGAGIEVTHIAEDFRGFEVKMELSERNQNYVGAHFGGSLYSMCDPFFMLALVRNLGPEFFVLDQEATIRFKKPGEGTVFARFSLTGERIEAIRAEALKNRKCSPTFSVQVVDDSGAVVAEVEKTVYVRRRKA